MKRRRSSVLRFALVSTLALLVSPVAALADRPVQTQAAEAETLGDTVLVADAHGTTPRELEPRYEPAPVDETRSDYNSDYIFGMTRGVADSTIHPAGKAPLFLLTVPLDIALLPFAVIGGFFG